MESLVGRWKEKLAEMSPSEGRPNPLPPVPPSHQTQQHSPTHNQMKKSVEKSKKSLHSHDGKASRRLTTPSKKKNKSK